MEREEIGNGVLSTSIHVTGTKYGKTKLGRK